MNNTENLNGYYTIVTCRFNGRLVQVSPNTNPYISYKWTGYAVEGSDGWLHDEKRKTFTYEQGCAEVLNGMHYTDCFDEENGHFETEAEAVEALKKYQSWCRRDGYKLDIAEAYVMYRVEDYPEKDEYLAFAPLTEDSETEFYI